MNVDEAARQLYDIIRRDYIPDLPDAEGRHLKVSSDVGLRWRAQEFPKVSLELMLDPREGEAGTVTNGARRIR